LNVQFFHCVTLSFPPAFQLVVSPPSANSRVPAAKIVAERFSENQYAFSSRSVCESAPRESCP
jgi:hypothetical protein